MLLFINCRYGYYYDRLVLHARREMHWFFSLVYGHTRNGSLHSYRRPTRLKERSAINYHTVLRDRYLEEITQKSAQMTKNVQFGPEMTEIISS
jgi:membrane-bound lytic murein transglycosylase MltF